MQKESRKWTIITGILFLVFLLFTVMVKTIDVQPVGPEESFVGFAGINQFVFELFGENLFLYIITDWLGAASIAAALGFAVLGLFQLIIRRDIRKVDARVLLLGSFYLIIVVFYFFFERVIINYRPVLLSGSLEASFPSSHTMIVICIMVTAMLQFHYYLRHKKIWLWAADSISVLMIIVTVAGRLVSGVHWLTDIVGGVLLSSALISLYCTALKYLGERK